jgi:hypothetical protein
MRSTIRRSWSDFFLVVALGASAGGAAVSGCAAGASLDRDGHAADAGVRSAGPVGVGGETTASG